ncbi:MAG TPA: sugar transferase [Verrucomicrobiae bacterium]|nr:sugar transferase [Verrucomicrobiae bacterium]
MQILSDQQPQTVEGFSRSAAASPSELGKRAFDILASALGLLLVLPLGAVIGLLIKLADRGPIFFGQIRIGRFGKPFRIWKFRSMVVDADRKGLGITGEDDPRITRIGRFLRKTKLDELPQLWNVLVGEMSLVGPRPEVARYVERYTSEQRQILQYRPGITDLASLLFRNEEALLRGAEDVEQFYLRYCLPKKIELNQQYGQRATVLTDAWIILQTLVPYWIGVLVLYFFSLALSFLLAYQLKTDFKATRAEYQEFRRLLFIIVLPQLMLLVWHAQLRGLLSYFSVPEMKRTFGALAGALLLQAALCYSLQRRLVPSPSILLMDFILSFFMLCGLRMTLRFLREFSSHPRLDLRARPQRVALIGTGESAISLMLDLTRSGNPAPRVVAFFDDDPHTWNKRPHNIPVIGMPECLLNREWLEQIDEVIVALPADRNARITQISEMLKGLPLKVTIVSRWPG